MKVTDESRKIAADVLGLFLDNPKIQDQSNWFHVRDNYYNADPTAQIVVSADPNICNTQLCAAGAVQWLKNGKAGLKKFNTDLHQDAVVEAGDALGLDHDERYDLFYDADDEQARAMLKAIVAGDERKLTRIREDLAGLA